MNNIKLIIIAFSVSLLMYACTPADAEFTGSEYMPDMAHSLALEANTSNYYYYNTFDKESTIQLNDLLKRPDLPVAGTIPRGYAGQFLHSNAGMEEARVTDINVPTNGSVPYYYVDTEESRAQAMAEIIENPFPITADGLARGKELYNVFCGICHGEKANGLGYLYDADQNPNAKYLAAPANLINEEFTAASNGRFYHAIMYGKNVMGAYKDKISYEERWQVIHYIRSLQAKEAGATYSEEENTFNAVFGTPGASITPYTHQSAMMMEHGEEHTDEATPVEGEHNTDQH
ncbi:cytochrome c [Lewinella sp. LCG006]|uniref:c-type cytochrome n=1 Tax=Lewinella sp. LCG006 TaxID=3231911 RepID=UPI0034602C34